VTDPLPSNDALLAFSQDIPWNEIEKQKRRFNTRLKELSASHVDDSLPLAALAEAAGVPLSLHYEESTHGNIILAEVGDRKHMMASFVSPRYWKNPSLLANLVPYNLNPAVNHSNLHETETPVTHMPALGAELELGLYYPDGTTPTEEAVAQFIDVYRHHAQQIGITPMVDREACQYQIEVHIAPGVGYHRTRQALDGILRCLVEASKVTGLYTAIMSAYPIATDFRLAESPKVQTAVDVMVEINGQFGEYIQRASDVKAQYHITPEANIVQVFRLQGCHIHLDIAGRSEALGLLTYYTMLRSASALVNKAVLKGGPFVNGTCDAERTCVREHLRSTTVTGRMIEIPVSPHFHPDGLERYGALLRLERANAPVRAHLYDDGLGSPIAVMHNPLGRLRPDLGSTKRICTVESTGLPVNISASRQAAVLADFEYTNVLIEQYFRQHGLDLAPMRDDPTLWAIAGPLDIPSYQAHQETSDRVGSEMVVQTAAGTSMTLSEFYEMKRLYLHQHLIDVADVTPRDIDEVYMSLHRMLTPPSGRIAQSIEEYITSPTCRSTGNWGALLRDAFIEEGGIPGEHDPDAVLRVANRVHEALVVRYPPQP
jgi:hypothetical protein